MWTQGTIRVKDSNGRMVSVTFWVKHYEEESQFGIDNGRISKLMLKQDGRVVYNYDSRSRKGACGTDTRIQLNTCESRRRAVFFVMGVII